MRTENKSNKLKIVPKMLDIDPAISVITLKISGLSAPIKIDIVRVDQKTAPNYPLSTLYTR